MHEEWEKRDHTKWEMINFGWNPSGLKFRESKECLGGEKIENNRERLKRNDEKSCKPYI